MNEFSEVEYVRYWYIPHTGYGVVWKATRTPITEKQQQNKQNSFWTKLRDSFSFYKNRLIGYYLYQILLWYDEPHFDLIVLIHSFSSSQNSAYC
jgi:hypothetical protein